MIVAAQSKFWGKSIEEATEHWVNLGVNHIMVKKTNDFPLIGQDSKARADDFKKLARLQKEYSVSYHVHPFNMSILSNGLETFLNSYVGGPGRIFKAFVESVDKQVQENGLYPLITLHPSTVVGLKEGINYKESEVIGPNREFFQDLNVSSRIAVENMPAPHRTAHYNLGYTADQLSYMVGARRFGLCIDTGHLNMAFESLKGLLSSKIPVVTVHFDGNDGTGDQHLMPTTKNVRNSELIEQKLLDVCSEKIVVLEIRNYDYTKEQLKLLVENTKRGKMIEENELSKP